jgi:hypothetical protein
MILSAGDSSIRNASFCEGKICGPPAGIPISINVSLLPGSMPPALIPAIGTGLGNTTTHELGHQFGMPQMDCSDPAKTPCPGGGPAAGYYEFYSTGTNTFQDVPLQWTPDDIKYLKQYFLKF